METSGVPSPKLPFHHLLFPSSWLSPSITTWFHTIVICPKRPCLFRLQELPGHQSFTSRRNPRICACIDVRIRETNAYNFLLNRYSLKATQRPFSFAMQIIYTLKQFWKSFQQDPPQVPHRLCEVLNTDVTTRFAGIICRIKPTSLIPRLQPKASPQLSITRRSEATRLCQSTLPGSLHWKISADCLAARYFSFVVCQ